MIEENENLSAIVRAKEQELRLLRYEVAVIYDSVGTVLLEKRSAPDRDYEIEFTDSEIETMLASHGVVFTHNHPRGWNYEPDDPRHSGNSFSPEDIRLACLAQMAEIRAVTPERVFSMRPSLEGWNEVSWNQIIRPLYEMIYIEVKQSLYSAALRREITPLEASARLDDEIWTRVAGLLGMHYNSSKE